MHLPRASIIVNNFNYGRFLRESIDSALGQTYQKTEVVVVDDGSTDDSRSIIESYGSKVVPLLKDNGGQGSAFNAGLRRSRGHIVLFLDADDALRPTALERAVPLFEDPDVVKVHWRLTVMDGNGNVSNRTIPHQPPAHGDLRQAAIRNGPDVFRWPPTSGNAWTRAYLEQILPVPEDLYDNGVDNCLFQLAPYYGKIASVPTSQTYYRLHGGNDSRTLGFEKKLARQIAFYEDYSARAIRRCVDQGWAIDADRWREKSWWCRLESAARTLEAAVPPGSAFVLVDENSWGLKHEFRGRRVIPFSERDGEYWGLPADSTSAIAEVERALSKGAGYLALAWSSFWVLEHYGTLADYLHTRHRCALRTERLLLFALDS